MRATFPSPRPISPSRSWPAGSPSSRADSTPAANSVQCPERRADVPGVRSGPSPSASPSPGDPGRSWRGSNRSMIRFWSAAPSDTRQLLAPVRRRLNRVSSSAARRSSASPSAWPVLDRHHDRPTHGSPAARRGWGQSPAGMSSSGGIGGSGSAARRAGRGTHASPEPARPGLPLIVPGPSPIPTDPALPATAVPMIVR